ncbi:phosphate ABC transporter substrate-binding protein [Echinimonas agarilytica]|uniref:Phosphate ABC transporter substrate-binding protein n=1 Tax=Echinimonas agarilytica TaxID=1215918 RepID=A0AA41W569_9GAMM|nr:phosphate ABC transporter substrate-binding protein [Echinimonas agarilytica]MCM2678845.1 phosphate ABC transporter substrate-binding protein [Echinimonas agarilytica]
MNKKVLLAVASMLLSGSAFAGVVVIGNPATGDALNAKQAEALYLGKSKSLPGGMQATIMELPDGNPMRQEFHSKVTGKSESQLKSYWSRLVFTGKATAPSEQGSTAAMKAAVAATPGAVGYIDESEVDASVTVLFKP